MAGIGLPAVRRCPVARRRGHRAVAGRGRCRSRSREPAAGHGGCLPAGGPADRRARPGRGSSGGRLRPAFAGRLRAGHADRRAGRPEPGRLVNALLALAASALWGTSDFGGGLLSRQLNPSVAVFLSQALALAGLLALLPFLHVPAGRYMFAAAAGGVLATLSLAAFYRAMATAPMSLVAPITAAGTGIPVVAGLIRGDHLGPLQLAGILVTLAGVVLAS